MIWAPKFSCVCQDHFLSPCCFSQHRNSKPAARLPPGCMSGFNAYAPPLIAPWCCQVSLSSPPPLPFWKHVVQKSLKAKTNAKMLSQKAKSNWVARFFLRMKLCECPCVCVCVWGQPPKHRTILLGWHNIWSRILLQGEALCLLAFLALTVRNILFWFCCGTNESLCLDDCQKWRTCLWQERWRLEEGRKQYFNWEVC